MQIDPAAASVYSVFSQWGTTGDPSNAETGPTTAAAGDTVAISAAGQTAAALDAVGNGRLSMADLKAGLGDADGDGRITLAEMQAHADQLTAKAEQGLWRLASETGVDLRDVTIRSDGTGKMIVEGDDPNAAKLEAAINEDGDVRNALIGARSTSDMVRIGKAVGMAYSAAQSNPSGADDYYAWARSIAEQTKAMDMLFSISGGKLTARYESAAGSTLGVSEGLADSARAAGLPASAIG
jgi:hypothetical protein